MERRCSDIAISEEGECIIVAAHNYKLIFCRSSNTLSSHVHCLKSPYCVEALPRFIVADDVSLLPIEPSFPTNCTCNHAVTFDICTHDGHPCCANHVCNTCKADLVVATNREDDVDLFCYSYFEKSSTETGYICPCNSLCCSSSSSILTVPETPPQHGSEHTAYVCSTFCSNSSVGSGVTDSCDAVQDANQGE